MAQSCEQQILGAFLINRALLDRVDLDKSFFKTDKQRLIFTELQKGAADSVVVTQRIRQRAPGFDDVYTYISACMDGLQHMTPSGLQQMIADEKKRRLELEIEGELKATLVDHLKVQKLYAKIAALEVTDNGTKPESLKALAERTIPPREHIVKPLIAKGEVVVMSSYPKIGKTVLGLNIAIKTAKGENWIDFEIPKSRRSLIFQHELSPAALKKRIEKMTASERNNDFLDLIKHHNERNLLVTKKSSFQKINDLIAEIKPDLIKFDSLIDFHDKKETSAEEMGEVMAAFRKLAHDHNAAILIIHHFAKMTEGREGGYLARGSSVISAASDANWQIHRLRKDLFEMESDEDYLKTVELSFESRHCGALRPIALKMNENLIFEKIEIRKRTKIDEWDICEAIRNLGGQATQTEIRKQFSCGQKTFIRAIQKAEDAGIIDSTILEGPGNPKLLMIPAEGGRGD